MSINYELEKRMQHWAAWTLSFIEDQQGHSRESSIYRFLEYGFMSYENTVKTSSIPYHNPKAEKVNACFNRLKVEYPDRAEAICYYYLSRKKQYQLAADLKISTRTFRARVYEGKLWMAASLGL
jgi:hypothetical protein